MYGDGLRATEKSLFYPPESLSTLHKVYTYSTTNPSMALDSQGFSDLDFRTLGYLIWQSSNTSNANVVNIPIYRKCGTVMQLGVGECRWPAVSRVDCAIMLHLVTVPFCFLARIIMTSS